MTFLSEMHLKTRIFIAQTFEPGSNACAIASLIVESSNFIM